MIYILERDLTHIENCIDDDAGDAESDSDDEAVGGRLHVLLDLCPAGGLEAGGGG